MFFAMNVMVCTLVLWSFDVYRIDTEGGPSRALFDVLRYASLFCADARLVATGGTAG